MKSTRFDYRIPGNTQASIFIPDDLAPYLNASDIDQIAAGKRITQAGEPSLLAVKKSAIRLAKARCQGICQ